MRILILMMLFFVLMCIVSFLSVASGSFIDVSSRNGILLQSALQNILAFCAPPILLYMILRKNPWKELGMKKDFTPAATLLSLAILIVALPAFGKIIDWNENLHLPASMSALETAFRQLEDNAAGLTDVLLSATSTGSLISGILIIGLLTGFSEELFFRAGLQKLICGTSLGTHGGVWLAAFVFSVMHFQFFGFVPRLLLGALLGYVYLWSGSIWIPALLHAFNNSMVVYTQWCEKSGHQVFDFETFGLSGTPEIILMAASALLTVFLIMAGRRFIPRWQHVRLESNT